MDSDVFLLHSIGSHQGHTGWLEDVAAMHHLCTKSSSHSDSEEIRRQLLQHRDGEGESDEGARAQGSYHRRLGREGDLNRREVPLPNS